MFSLLYLVAGGLVAKLCQTLATPQTVAPRLLCSWDSPSKNTGMGCHFLHQEIFPTQELNPGLLHCRWILYQLSYKGSCISPPLFTHALNFISYDLSQPSSLSIMCIKCSQSKWQLHSSIFLTPFINLGSILLHNPCLIQQQILLPLLSTYTQI